jgi:AcrR family transcriptional regulator
LAQDLKTSFEARKTPVQARSNASVDAIVEATLQVLLEVGKERLTTTRVAARAGVSVGTLYQYFPNKSALLRAVLKRHLGFVAEAVEAACLARKGDSLEGMAEGLVNAFFDAKLAHVKSSRAMYAVSDDVDGGAVSREMGERIVGAIVAMLETAPEGLRTDAEVAAVMLQGAMAGVSRRMLESGSPEVEIARLRTEAIVLARSYLSACSGRSV